MRSLLRLTLALAIWLAAVLPAPALDLFNLKNSLIQFALEQISTEDFSITAENVESPGDGVTDLVGVQISDRRGVWFEAERMGLQWNARRILSGELEINRLAASGVRVLRAPEGEVEVKEGAEIAEQDGEPFDWPRSPITTRVEVLELTRVFIAEGVIADQSLAFDATGSARDEGDEQSLQLTLTRTDAISGRIAVDYVRQFSSNRLKANLEAEEAAGGLVAALAGFPDDSASRVTLKADGPLTDWAMDFAAATERVFEADGTARVDIEGPLAVRAAFRVAPGPAIHPTAAALLGAEARIDIDIAEDAAGVIAIRKGAVRSPALTLDAAGSYDKATGAADLDILLDGKADLAKLAEGVAFDGFGFEGQVRGTVEDLAATGLLRLDGLTTDPADIGRARLQTEVTRMGERIDFAVNGNAEALRLDRIGAQLLGAALLDIRGSFENQRLVLSGLTLDSNPLHLAASGGLDLGAETAALDYRLATPELGPFAAAYGVMAGGAARITGHAAGPLAAIRVTGQLAAEGLSYAGERYGTVRLDHDVTAGETVSGTLDLDATGSPYGPLTADLDFALADEVLDLARLEATALGARIDGVVAYDLASGLATGTVKLDAPDLAPLAAFAGAPVRGAASGSVGLTGEDGTQGLRLDLALDGVDGFGATAERARLTSRIDDVENLDAVGAELEAEGLGYAAAGARIARLTAQIVAVNALSDLPGGRITASAGGIAASGVTLDTAEVTARLTPDAGRANAEAEIALGGLAAGGARIPSARIDASGTDLLGAGARAEARLTAPRIAAEGATVEAVRLTARVEDPATDPRIAARLESGAVTAGSARLERIEATVNGVLSRLVAQVATQGAADGEPVALSVRAEIDAAREAPLIRVTELTARYKEEQAALRAPLRITAGDSIRLDGIDLALPGGGLTGEAALHPAGLSAELALALADLGIARRLADAPIAEGSLDLRLGIDTRPGRARGQMQLSLDGLRFDEGVTDIGQLGISARGDWDGRQADLDAALAGPFGDPFRVTAAVPLRASGGPLPRVPASAPLSGRVVWSGDIGRLWALVPAPGHVLDGPLEIDLGIDGTLDAPKLTGRVAMTEGRYENLDTGTILTSINLRSELLGGDRIRLDLDARDGAEGRLEATATVSPEAVEATLKSRGAVLVRRDDATAAISLDILAAGPLDGPDISGTVTIDRAEIRLVSATPPSVVTLGDVRIKGAPVEPKEEAAGSTVALDVKIRAPRDIFVRGRGLDSEWRASIDVGGTAAAPRLTGSVERIRGRLSLIGTNFELETGTISFTGGREIDPRIEVRLQADENDVTGGIAVDGSASDPEITFYSQQGLPEDEVLPRILFGTSSQSLSASQAIRLASGLATLLDGSGGLVDDVRSSVGLDTLAIDPTDDSAEISIGKNVTDTVYVGAKQSLDGAETRLSVEVEVYEDIIVDSEVDQEGNTSVGINWKTDF
ncbi:translocation/assembly module TamB domain-containing protein [Paralimibaculum aggregatum]|uniref:Translocation/assembly module TamB domain-containing protein n=1 Tax=Paralimibaculum aggregatum TaxID=3036245 RepID=A0ABQ6LGY7_9RHOB|nr:translocation/assembly module TamB domain-containing protein [Limibaculum sp. NKW23]GMG81354.1 translocation/assembly module TamB domain-containing protein [Limibaculum sp. NKW23]